MSSEAEQLYKENQALFRQIMSIRQEVLTFNNSTDSDHRPVACFPKSFAVQDITEHVRVPYYHRAHRLTSHCQVEELIQSFRDILLTVRMIANMCHGFATDLHLNRGNARFVLYSMTGITLSLFNSPIVHSFNSHILVLYRWTNVLLKITMHDV